MALDGQAPSNGSEGASAHDGRTRILLVDDHPLLRAAVRDLIEAQPDLTICAEADDGPSALARTAESNPHLVLLDLSLDGTNGLDLIGRMIRATPSLHIVILSMHDDSHRVEQAILAGARGYVSKQEDPDGILAAIRSVIRGNVYLSPAMAHRDLKS